MTTVENCPDNCQYGEKNHLEYKWSFDIKEKILQLSFQLIRSDKLGILSLEKKLTEILTELIRNKSDESKYLLSILYKMIGHTRDIIDGKGECALTYMMIYTWYDFFPVLSLYALETLVLQYDILTIPYGSWKDLKYFCEYCKNKNKSLDHPLIQKCISLMNNQLKTDLHNNKTNSIDISLVAKWIPREKSSFKWIYEAIATNYFNEYIITATTTELQCKAILKCKTEYRKILSTLNKYLDTLQIKQSSKNWDEINFKNVTSISLSKQKNAFLNIKKNHQPRYIDDMDRIKCASNFETYIKKSVNYKIELKGKRIGMADFTKQACIIYKSPKDQFTKIKTDLLNSQWRDNSSCSTSFGKMIAMVDVSGSMEGDPMNVAIALGIRIAEKSILGKRIMTFSNSPSWVNLEPYKDFVSQTEIIMKSDWGGNTNLYAAFDLILNTIVTNKMNSDDVKDMIFVILSDMQFDCADKNEYKTVYETIKIKYAEAGKLICGKPYNPPHILFWNLKNTSGFPSLSTQLNVSMMSGFSPALLNLFCEQGIEALQFISPWIQLEKSLENQRYSILSDKLEREY